MQAGQEAEQWAEFEGSDQRQSLHTGGRAMNRVCRQKAGQWVQAGEWAVSMQEASKWVGRQKAGQWLEPQGRAVLPVMGQDSAQSLSRR